MKTVMFLAGWLGLAAALVGAADASDIEYADFSSTAGLTLNGDAAASGGSVLRLVPDESGQWGSAFTTSPLTLSPDGTFSTNFAFRITDDGQGTKADGLTFILHRDARGAAALGAGGGNMGYGDDQGSLDILPSLAVEFDPFWYVLPTEPHGTHVGIDVNGNMASVASALTPTSLANGLTKYAWVDYDGASSSMSVYLSETSAKPASALLTYTTDLVSILGDNQGIYAGFSAGTGGERAAHDILSWQFDGIQEAPSSPRIYAVCFGARQTAGILDQHVFYGDLEAVDVLGKIRDLPNAKEDGVLYVPNSTNPVPDIQAAIQQVASSDIRPGDTFILFATCHGGQVSTGSERPDLLGGTGDEFLGTGDGDGSTGQLTDDTLTGFLDLPGMEDVNKIVILTGCHSGGFWGGQDLLGGDLDSLGGHVALIAGAREELPALWWSGGYSALGEALIGALTQDEDGFIACDTTPKDGRISFDELEAYLDGYTFEDGLDWRVLDFGDPAEFSFEVAVTASTDFPDTILDVPEPATLAVLLAGGLALLGRRQGTARGVGSTD